MQITNKFMDEFTARIREGGANARLSAKTMPWQTESSLRPLYDLLTDSLDKGSDSKWSEVQAVLDKIPADKKIKYKRAIDFLTAKKGSWDLFHNRVSGWGKFSAADFEEHVTVPGRGATLLIRGEGMTPGDMREIIRNLQVQLPLIHQLASNPKLGPRRDWFAANSLGEVQTALENLDKYLNHRCTRITFKRLHVGMRCDSDVNDPSDVVTRSLAGQVVPTVMLAGEDRPDFRKKDGYLKVPSGIKVFLGPLYWSVRNNYDAILKTPAIYRWMTLAHELTHKVIKTTDKCYELSNCKNIKDSPDAVMCADSWAYFLTEYWKTPDFTLRDAAARRRAAMGYDD